MSRKEMEKELLKYYIRLGYENYDKILADMSDQQIAVLYDELITETEEHDDPDYEI